MHLNYLPNKDTHLWGLAGYLAFKTISNFDTIHGLQWIWRLIIIWMLPFIPGTTVWTHEYRRQESRIISSIKERIYLSRKTPSDNFPSEILDKYSVKRYDEKLGSIDTAVTSGFSWPYSISWIDNLVGFEHCNLQNKTTFDHLYFYSTKSTG